jgi:hypothetical protein
LTFSGVTGPVSGVTTTINLTKCDNPISSTGECLGRSPNGSFNSEIQLRLQSPTGTTVVLVPTGALTGQSVGDTVSWTFDDSASSVVSGSSLVSGTFLPSTPLSAFIGESGNGIWNLLFADNRLEDPLSINSWSLTVNEPLPVPPGALPVPGPLPVLGAASAFGFSRRLRGRIASSRPQS